VEPAVIVRDVTVERGGRAVLRDVTLTVSPGEVVALVGPNGSGKSSLVGTIAGDLPIVRGTVTLAGRPVAGWTPVEAAMRRAVLPQQSTVAFGFRVREVVAMGRAPWAGTEREEADEKILEAAMASMEVDHLIDRPFNTLSGGERARVALARVLAQDTGVLMLDEPTAALDIRHQELVMRAARDRSVAGVAVVVVLHDLGAAAAHADRIVVLDQGAVIADDVPATVLDPVLLERVYAWPIEVVPHPTSGVPLVLPTRRRTPGR
jgi:iron complex transport system ATP-binding protein